MIRYFAAVLLALLPALPAHAGALQDAVLAHAKAQGDVQMAFTRTTTFESVDKKGERERKVFIDRYDPAKPAKSRWQLVSIDGQSPTAKELKTAAKRYEKEEVPSYARLTRWVGQPASEGANELRFDSFAKDTFQGSPVDLSGKLSGVATISRDGGKPWVSETRFRLKEPTRIMLVAKLDDMRTQSRFRRMPDGTPVLDSQTVTMTGSMMGKSGTQKTVTTYSDYRRIG
ncbi:MAG: hypothetical protein WA979_13910 [Pacificimonas sp.]